MNVLKTIGKVLTEAISGGTVEVIDADMETAVADVADVVVAGAIDATDESAAAEAPEAVVAGTSVADQEPAAIDEPPVAAAAAVSDEVIGQAYVLPPGMVALTASDLDNLRADAAEWNKNKDELVQLQEWKASSGNPNVIVGAVDAADAAALPRKKVSAQTQAAIDLQERIEAQSKP
jgi:hypothetical protein